MYQSSPPPPVAQSTSSTALLFRSPPQHRAKMGSFVLGLDQPMMHQKTLEHKESAASLILEFPSNHTTTKTLSGSSSTSSLRGSSTNVSARTQQLWTPRLSHIGPTDTGRVLRPQPPPSVVAKEFALRVHPINLTAPPIGGVLTAQKIIMPSIEKERLRRQRRSRTPTKEVNGTTAESAAAESPVIATSLAINAAIAAAAAAAPVQAYSPRNLFSSSSSTSIAAANAHGTVVSPDDLTAPASTDRSHQRIRTRQYPNYLSAKPKGLWASSSSAAAAAAATAAFAKEQEKYHQQDGCGEHLWRGRARRRDYRHPNYIDHSRSRSRRRTMDGSGSDGGADDEIEGWSDGDEQFSLGGDTTARSVRHRSLRRHQLPSGSESDGGTLRRTRQPQSSQQQQQQQQQQQSESGQGANGGVIVMPSAHDDDQYDQYSRRGSGDSAASRSHSRSSYHSSTSNTNRNGLHWSRRPRSWHREHSRRTSMSHQVDSYHHSGRGSVAYTNESPINETAATRLNPNDEVKEEVDPVTTAIFEHLQQDRSRRSTHESSDGGLDTDGSPDEDHYRRNRQRRPRRRDSTTNYDGYGGGGGSVRSGEARSGDSHQPSSSFDPSRHTNRARSSRPKQRPLGRNNYPPPPLGATSSFGLSSTGRGNNTNTVNNTTSSGIPLASSNTSRFFSSGLSDQQLMSEDAEYAALMNLSPSLQRQQRVAQRRHELEQAKAEELQKMMQAQYEKEELAETERERRTRRQMRANQRRRRGEMTVGPGVDGSESGSDTGPTFMTEAIYNGMHEEKSHDQLFPFERTPFSALDGIAYRFQGNKAMNKKQMLAARQKLERHPLIREKIFEYWRIFEWTAPVPIKSEKDEKAKKKKKRDPDAGPNDSDDEKRNSEKDGFTINRAQYITLHMNMTKALHEIWSLKSSFKLAETEWRKDVIQAAEQKAIEKEYELAKAVFRNMSLKDLKSAARKDLLALHISKSNASLLPSKSTASIATSVKSAPIVPATDPDVPLPSILDDDEVLAATMNKAVFTAALFEVVDLWTETVEVSEYVSFLTLLLTRITKPNPDYIDENAKRKKRRKRPAPGVNPLLQQSPLLWRELHEVQRYKRPIHLPKGGYYKILFIQKWWHVWWARRKEKMATRIQRAWRKWLPDVRRRRIQREMAAIKIQRFMRRRWLRQRQESEEAERKWTEIQQRSKEAEEAQAAAAQAALDAVQDEDAVSIPSEHSSDDESNAEEKTREDAAITAAALAAKDFELSKFSLRELRERLNHQQRIDEQARDLELLIWATRKLQRFWRDLSQRKQADLAYSNKLAQRRIKILEGRAITLDREKRRRTQRASVNLAFLAMLEQAHITDELTRAKEKADEEKKKEEESKAAIAAEEAAKQAEIDKQTQLDQQKQTQDELLKRQNSGTIHVPDLIPDLMLGIDRPTPTSPVIAPTSPAPGPYTIFPIVLPAPTIKALKHWLFVRRTKYPAVPLTAPAVCARFLYALLTRINQRHTKTHIELDLRLTGLKRKQRKLEKEEASKSLAQLMKGVVEEQDGKKLIITSPKESPTPTITITAPEPVPVIKIDAPPSISRIGSLKTVDTPTSTGSPAFLSVCGAASSNPNRKSFLLSLDLDSLSSDNSLMMTMPLTPMSAAAHAAAKITAEGDTFQQPTTLAEASQQIDRIEKNPLHSNEFLKNEIFYRAIHQLYPKLVHLIQACTEAYPFDYIPWRGVRQKSVLKRQPSSHAAIRTNTAHSSRRPSIHTEDLFGLGEHDKPETPGRQKSRMKSLALQKAKELTSRRKKSQEELDAEAMGEMVSGKKKTKKRRSTLKSPKKKNNQPNDSDDSDEDGSPHRSNRRMTYDPTSVVEGNEEEEGSDDSDARSEFRSGVTSPASDGSVTSPTNSRKKKPSSKSSKGKTKLKKKKSKSNLGSQDEDDASHEQEDARADAEVEPLTAEEQAAFDAEQAAAAAARAERKAKRRARKLKRLAKDDRKAKKKADRVALMNQQGITLEEAKLQIVSSSSSDESEASVKVASNWGGESEESDSSEDEDLEKLLTATHDEDDAIPTVVSEYEEVEVDEVAEASDPEAIKTADGTFIRKVKIRRKLPPKPTATLIAPDGTTLPAIDLNSINAISKDQIAAYIAALKIKQDAQALYNKEHGIVEPPLTLARHLALAQGGKEVLPNAIKSRRPSRVNVHSMANSRRNSKSINARHGVHAAHEDINKPSDLLRSLSTSDIDTLPERLLLAQGDIDAWRSDGGLNGGVNAEALALQHLDELTLKLFRNQLAGRLDLAALNQLRGRLNRSATVSTMDDAQQLNQLLISGSKQRNNTDGSPKPHLLKQMSDGGGFTSGPLLAVAGNQYSGGMAVLDEARSALNRQSTTFKAASEAVEASASARGMHHALKANIATLTAKSVKTRIASDGTTSEVTSDVDATVSRLADGASSATTAGTATTNTMKSPRTRKATVPASSSPPTYRPWRPGGSTDLLRPKIVYTLEEESDRHHAFKEKALQSAAALLAAQSTRSVSPATRRRIKKARYERAAERRAERLRGLVQPSAELLATNERTFRKDYDSNSGRRMAPSSSHTSLNNNESDFSDSHSVRSNRSSIVSVRRSSQASMKRSSVASDGSGGGGGNGMDDSNPLLRSLRQQSGRSDCSDADLGDRVVIQTVGNRTSMKFAPPIVTGETLGPLITINHASAEPGQELPYDLASSQRRRSMQSNAGTPTRRRSLSNRRRSVGANASALEEHTTAGDEGGALSDASQSSQFPLATPSSKRAGVMKLRTGLVSHRDAHDEDTVPVDLQVDGHTVTSPLSKPQVQFRQASLLDLNDQVSEDVSQAPSSSSNSMMGLTGRRFQSKTNLHQHEDEDKERNREMNPFQDLLTVNASPHNSSQNDPSASGAGIPFQITSYASPSKPDLPSPPTSDLNSRKKRGGHSSKAQSEQPTNIIVDAPPVVPRSNASHAYMDYQLRLKRQRQEEMKREEQQRRMEESHGDEEDEDEVDDAAGEPSASEVEGEIVQEPVSSVPTDLPPLLFVKPHPSSSSPKLTPHPHPHTSRVPSISQATHERIRRDRSRAQDDLGTIQARAQEKEATRLQERIARSEQQPQPPVALEEKSDIYVSKPHVTNPSTSEPQFIRDPKTGRLYRLMDDDDIPNHTSSSTRFPKINRSPPRGIRTKRERRNRRQQLQSDSEFSQSDYEIDLTSPRAQQFHQQQPGELTITGSAFSGPDTDYETGRSDAEYDSRPTRKHRVDGKNLDLQLDISSMPFSPPSQSTVTSSTNQPNKGKRFAILPTFKSSTDHQTYVIDIDDAQLSQLTLDRVLFPAVHQGKLYRGVNRRHRRTDTDRHTKPLAFGSPNSNQARLKWRAHYAAGSAMDYTREDERRARIAASLRGSKSFHLRAAEARARAALGGAGGGVGEVGHLRIDMEDVMRLRAKHATLTTTQSQPSLIVEPNAPTMNLHPTSLLSPRSHAIRRGLSLTTLTRQPSLPTFTGGIISGSESETDQPAHHRRPSQSHHHQSTTIRPKHPPVDEFSPPPVPSFSSSTVPPGSSIPSAISGGPSLLVRSVSISRKHQ